MPADPYTDFPAKLDALSGAGADTYNLGTNVWRGPIRPKGAYPCVFIRDLPVDDQPLLDSTSDRSVIVQCTVMGSRNKEGATGEARAFALGIRDLMHRADMTDIDSGYWECRSLTPTPRRIEQDGDDRTVFVVDFRVSWISSDS